MKFIGLHMRRAARGLAALLLGAAASLGAAQELAVVGARVYPAPDAPVIERGTVLVRDGRIVAVGPVGEVKVPPGARVIDASGQVATAGFWNSHVHFLQAPLRDPSRPAAELDAALQAMLTRWGFTSVFDIGSLPGRTRELRRRIEAGELPGPAILTTDALFFPAGGTPIYVRELFDSLRVPSMEVATPEEAATRARRQLAEGADGVKMMAGAIVGGPRGVLHLDTAIAKALADEAHRAGKLAVAHPSDLAGLEVALASGVDLLAHGTPTTGPWPPVLVQRLVAARMALTPTLALIEIELRQEGVPPHITAQIVGHAQQQVAAFAQAGGTLLFGTDVGYIEPADTRREFELLAGAGLGWRQILASLTTAPAARLRPGQGTRQGRIAPGQEADLVLLARDPAQDAAGFADVVLTLRAGRVLYQRARAAQPVTRPATQPGSQPSRPLIPG
jgi:imidazolonepropionase-like amidohydrolase